MKFRSRQARLTQPRAPWSGRAIGGMVALVTAELLLFGFLFVRVVAVPSSVGTTGATPTEDTIPDVRSKVLLSGRKDIWGMAFLPTGELLFTERSGTLGLYANGTGGQVARIPDVKQVGMGGGLLGLAVDPQFAENQYIYTCYTSTAGDIRVVRWVLAAGLNGLLEHKTIVAGIPAGAEGKHSGCQLTFGTDAYLWVATGDAQDSSAAQSPTSLGGKILRVDREGLGAPGNFSKPYDNRIFSFGHRNSQGLVFFVRPRAGDVMGLSTEHGNDIDDELNPLKPGNFGWAPPAGKYDESNVPMTDKTKYPSAVGAIWSSGTAAAAPSGISILADPQWGKWQGAAALSMLDGKHVKVLVLDNMLQVKDEVRLLDGTYGRIRGSVLGLDGNLYVSTANGKNDKIIRLSPQ